MHPASQGDVIATVYLQGDFDGCQRWADCDLYHRQYNHDHYFPGLHLFDWFLRGPGEVHLHPCYCFVLGEVHLHCRFPRCILSLLVAQRYLFGPRADMKRRHSSPCRKSHLTVILLLGMPGPLSSKCSRIMHITDHHTLLGS